MDDNTIKRLAVGTAMTGALSLAILGFSSGVASAKPHHPGPNPPGPSVTHNDTDNDTDTDENGTGDDNEDITGVWTPGLPPGQNPLGPPGQVKKLPTIGGVTNPFFGTPPGHWGDLNITIPETWQPPTATEPLTLEFNTELGQWGVYVAGNFVPYPIPLPAPQG